MAGIPLGDLLEHWEARDIATLFEVMDDHTEAIKRANQG